MVRELSINNTKAFPRIKEHLQGLLGTNRINEKRPQNNSDKKKIDLGGPGPGRYKSRELGCLPIREPEGHVVVKGLGVPAEQARPRPCRRLNVK